VPHCARETATEHFRSDDDAKKRSRGAFLLPHPEVRALASLEDARKRANGAGTSG
jgi:hypothetical protein